MTGLPEKPRCGVPTKSGKPCSVIVSNEGDLCAWHSDDPERKRLVQLGRMRGAISRVVQRVTDLDPIPFETPADVVMACKDALAIARSAGMEPHQYTRAVGSLGRVVIDAWRLMIPDGGNVEFEVSEIEQAIEAHDSESSSEFDIADLPPELRAQLESWMAQRGPGDQA